MSDDTNEYLNREKFREQTLHEHGLSSEHFETKDSGVRENLANGMVRDVEEGKTDYTLLLDGPLFERWAALLTRGAQKYGPRNWCKALESTDAAARAATTERFRRSAFRHMMQWLAGDRSEDHAAAVLFNLNGAEAMRDTDHRADVKPHTDPYALGDIVRLKDGRVAAVRRANAHIDGTLVVQRHDHDMSTGGIESNDRAWGGFKWATIVREAIEAVIS